MVSSIGTPELLPGPQRLLVHRDLVVTAEHGHVQAAGVDAEPLGDQLVAPAQRLAAAVVAERPRAEHLEHGQVGRIPHLVEIGGSQASLDAHESAPQRMRFPFQVRRQRMHPRGGEEHRITEPRNERGPGGRNVAAVEEVVDEGPADVHGSGPVFH